MTSHTAKYVISSIQRKDNRLIVHWGDQHQSTFHYIWLRDNCSHGGNPLLGKKQGLILEIPLDIVPKTININGNNHLEIIWQTDNHRSLYDTQWLRQHCYSAPERKFCHYQPILWDSQMNENLPEMDSPSMLTDDTERQQMLEYLRDYGICFVRNVPPSMGVLESVASSFGPIVETHFGRVFEIVLKPENENNSVANSGRELIPHTDDAYRNIPPDIIFFHCLAAAEDGSGQSMWVDGFKIAEMLRLQEPAAYDLLTRYAVRFHKRDTNTNISARGPLISLDAHGEVKSVRISSLFVAPFDVPEIIMEPFYRAYRMLLQRYTNKKFWLLQSLCPGDMVICDNHRVLHGRTAINTKQATRHLRHCYVDRDYLAC
ncbi:hypothetical protein AB835_05495 [Candidatus Endobugula sertula]|uniref:TauD/TfdA-like domain-containing protein n=1 Tax=Candidatus Endobugula sertula TaxID=62101 RepID=A0A1D2QR48_9GAMM|nr:hypothetical protein AB835_05495 [Candidatus Endobugula sertula]